MHHAEAVATLLLAFIGAGSYLYTRSHDRALQKHQNYLSLEFESIHVFQVCVEHPEIPIYLEGRDAGAALNPQINEKAYWFVCQVLNLFELIISYRKDKVVPNDVFATWVSWFYELGTAARFEEFWEGEELWAHYKRELREIMDTAIEFSKKEGRPSYDDELRAFHNRVARIMKDPSIQKHFDDARRLHRHPPA
jgi:hypothetical protein